MSTLETNSIGKYSTNNVSFDDALNLKSYTTAQRNALTSVAGDMIYNSDDSKVQVYDGSAWQDLGGVDGFVLSYLIIAGGGGGGGAYSGTGIVAGGGGGAGGYRNSYASETSGGNSSTELKPLIQKSTNYTVTVGAGGAAVPGGTGYPASGNNGNNSLFASNIAIAGGAGSGYQQKGADGGSGGGAGNGASGQPGGNPTQLQGFAGGAGSSLNYEGAGGGGGAGAAGTAGTASTAGDGGNGLASSITGSSVTRAGGGGGSEDNDAGTGGTGGGGDGAHNTAATAGTVNTGSGGGGVSDNNYASGAGGSGIVILRYATADATISIGAGLTSSSTTDGSDTVVTFTAGTGTVSWS